MKALLAGVIAMGILIVAGTSVLVVLIVQRLGGKGASAQEAPLLLHEPVGSRVMGVSSDGKVLTLLVTGPGGETVEVRELGSGALVREVVVGR